VADRLQAPERPASAARPALAGLALGVLGVASYLLVVYRLGAWLPEVRNRALPNLALVAAGLALSGLGVARTLARRGSARGRLLAPVLAVVNLTLASAFLWLLYGLAALPPAAGPTLAAPAPDFALADEQGRTVRLADFRGAPLLLVFYRGHW
jgi:hypothetical protein